MKIALVQLNYVIGDIEGNTAKILAEIAKAKEAKTDIAVFSELAICGYPPKDLLDYPSFIERCETGLAIISEASEGIAVVVLHGLDFKKERNYITQPSFSQIKNCCVE